MESPGYDGVMGGEIRVMGTKGGEVSVLGTIVSAKMYLNFPMVKSRQEIRGGGEQK